MGHPYRPITGQFLHCAALSAGRLFFFKSVMAGSFHHEVLNSLTTLHMYASYQAPNLTCILSTPLWVPKCPLDDRIQFLSQFWVKGLQLKTGCPIEEYFKLWAIDFTKPNPCAHMLPVACGKRISNTRESLGNIMKSLSNIKISLS